MLAILTVFCIIVNEIGVRCCKAEKFFKKYHQRLGVEKRLIYRWMVNVRLHHGIVSLHRVIVSLY